MRRRFGRGYISVAGFVRFVGDDFDESSGEPVGIFQLAHDLHDSQSLARTEQLELRTLLDWFRQHLPSPRRHVAWLKPAAQEHIERCWQLTRILRAHGIAVDMVRTRKPGYVTYEDEWQVAALPCIDDD